MVRKIFIYQTIVFLFLLCMPAFAGSIDTVINSNPAFSPAITAISVKDLKTGQVLYQKNAKTLVHPASTLKVVTSAAALDYLGADYNFTTSIYKDGDKVYFKTGADPLFTYADMMGLVSQFKTRYDGAVKKFYIDDTIVDKIPFGVGWQWDDNASVHFPVMSPYIINNNLFMVKAHLSSRNVVSIEYAQEYKESVINRLKYGSTTKFSRDRNLFVDNGAIVLDGTINKTTVIDIPAKNPTLLYQNVLVYAFLNSNIPLNINFKYGKVPRFVVEEASVRHSILDVITKINQNSNNLAAEILIKHAGAVRTEKTGTTKDGLDMVAEYYTNNGVDMKEVQLADASGVSMNDYVSADFMTSALRVISNSPNFESIKNSMTDGSVGTFTGRLPELNGKLKVKTGTLANTSAVVGYLTTQSGRKVAFAVILDNMPKNLNPKSFEDKIIKAIADFY